MSPVRVAFLVPTVHDLGGTASAVTTQAGALAGRHDVTVLSLYGPDGEPHFTLDPRVTVRDLVDELDLPAPDEERLARRSSLLVDPAWDPNLDARADLALERALPRLEADVVVTVTPALLAAATRLLPPGVALVHQEHRSSSQRSSSLDVLLTHAPLADTVAMLTEPMADWLVRTLGARAPHVVAVPNALPPGHRPRSPLTAPVVVAAGRLAREKQWTHLVAAFALVADRMPGWRLRILGDGHARFDILGTARKLGLWDRVEVPGATRDLAGEWARASISALTSSSEGYPLVLQEAMAAGVPVVSYDCPSGPRAIVDDGVDGLLVSQGSQAGVAAALLRLATDPAERQRLGRNARAKAATWDAAATSARWDEVLAAAVARRRDAAGRSSALLLAPDDVRPAVLDQDTAPEGREAVGVTPVQARREILAAAARAAAAVSDDWFVVPDRPGVDPTVVLPMAARRRFLHRLVAEQDTAAGLPAYTSLHDPEHQGWPARRGTPAEVVPALARGRTGRVLLEPWPRVDGRGSLVGRGCTVAVEFWEEGPDGERHSPGRAAWTRTVPARATTVTERVADVDVPLLPGTQGPTVHELAAPVDVVCTWVDGGDEAWDRARERRLAEVSDATMRSRASSGRARYVDRGELRWSLRSVHLFAPWVRRIHLVTAGQVPPWLDPEHPQVHLVDHRDVMPTDALPTFNSHAIEAALHHVDGLAEHFVYLNDDFFLAAPTRPETWFTPAGQPLVFPSPLPVGLPGQPTLPFALAADHNRRLVEGAFGRTLVTTLAHAPYPHRVSLLREVEARFPEAVAATVRSPFRSATDVSMLSSLAQHVGLATGEAVVGELDAAYVDLTEPAVGRRLRDLLRRDRDTFCLGDSHDFARDPANVAALVSETLETLFPVAAPWER